MGNQVRYVDLGLVSKEMYTAIWEYQHIIDIKEPTKDETIKILQGLKRYYENYHGIKYSSSAIISAVELSYKYIGDRKLPDKAIDVIDEAGASQYLLPSSSGLLIIRFNKAIR